MEYRCAKSISLFFRGIRASCNRYFSSLDVNLVDWMFMAQVCEMCGRGPQFGNRISHAHNVTKRRWNVNLQTVRALVNGAGKRIRVCTSCIRSGKVQKVA